MPSLNKGSTSLTYVLLRLWASACECGCSHFLWMSAGMYDLSTCKIAGYLTLISVFILVK